jgi:protein-disulfide isomerase
LFENYNALENTDLKKYAVDLNLNASQFNECFDSGKYMESIQNDLNDGQCLGVDGTPTFFVGNNETGYEKIVGANSFSVFKEVIDSKL